MKCKVKRVVVKHAAAEKTRTLIQEHKNIFKSWMEYRLLQLF